MKNIIKNLLKEEIKNKPTIGKNVFLIMHKSGELAFTKLLTYGTYWVELDNYTQIENIKFSKENEAKEFLKLVIHCFNHPEKICSYKLQYEDQRENFKPEEWEIVEYVMGLTPKQDVSNIFGDLKESKRKSEHQYKKGDVITVDGYISGKFFNNNIGTILGFWAGQLVVLFENWYNGHKGPSFPYDPKPIYTKCGKDSCWLIPFNNQNDGNHFTIEVSPFNELDIDDIFNQLKEDFNPENLGWANELVNRPIKFNPKDFIVNDIIKWVPIKGYDNYEECHGRIYEIKYVGYGLNNPIGDWRSYSVTNVRCYPRNSMSSTSWVEGSQWERNHDFYLLQRDSY